MMPKILCHLIKISTLISNLRFLASFRRLEESTHNQMKLNRCSHFYKLCKKHKNPISYSFFNKVYPKSHLDWPFTLLWGQISYSKMNHISIISIEWINWARYVTCLDTIFISNLEFLKCGHVMMWIRYICSCWYIARYAVIAITY